MSRRVLFAVCLLLAAAAVFSASGYGDLRAARPFDEAPAKDVAEAIERLSAFGPEQRAVYRRFLGFDVAFLLLNAGALSILIHTAVRTLARRAGGARLLLAVPWCFAVADLIEDAAIWRMLATFPEIQGGVIATARMATAVKFTAFVASWLAICGLWLVALVRRRAGRQGP